MKRRNSIAIRILSMMIALLLLSTSYLFAEGSEVTHYVALGDSLTAGYEPWMKQQWEKNNNSDIVPYGFVDRLYEQFLYQGRTTANNYGIIGLTSNGFYNFMQAVEASRVITASELQERDIDPRTNDILAKIEEIRSNIIQADIITITIGANDFLDLYSLYSEKSEAELQTIVDQRINNYTEKLTKSLNIIFSLNPKVHVIVADQYQPFPKIAEANIYAKLVGYSEQLTLALEKIIENMQLPATQLQVAYVANSFLGNELAYLNINLVETEKTDLHPKQKGYEAMANVFSNILWGDYKEVTSKDPIGIVVQGKELQTPYKPILENGTTYVPVREYVEALGGIVEWDQATSSAIAKFNDLIVKYKADSNIIEVNGVPVEMNVSVKLIKLDPKDNDSKTYVPLRALAEDGLQFDVKYIQQSKTAYINP